MKKVIGLILTVISVVLMGAVFIFGFTLVFDYFMDRVFHSGVPEPYVLIIGSSLATSIFNWMVVIVSKEAAEMTAEE